MIDPESHVFGYFIMGHRIEPSPRSVIGLQALADHPHLLLAVRQVQQGAAATSYVAGATGKLSLLEETLEDQSAQSPVRVSRLMAWRAAEAFGQLRVLKMLRSRYVGDNGLIVVGDTAARHGRVDILEWLWQDDKFAPGPGCPYGPYDGRYWTKAEVAASWMDSAARGGNIASINWLLNHGVPLRESACNRASTYGHVEALELLRRHGCPWSSATTAAAAKDNQLDALKWLRANGCPWGTEVVLVACGHRLSMLEWCLDNGAPVQADICTAIAACYVRYFDLRVVRNAVSAIAAIRALGYACNGDTVTALLTCSTYAHYGDGESDSKARREVISSGLKLCLLDGVTPTSELLMVALKAGEYLAAEVMLERDPSLMAPTPALRYFVDAINKSSALPVYSVTPMIRWLVRAGAELSPDLYVIAAKPAAFWSANAQAHIHLLQALRACGCQWDASVTAAVVELASAERPDASSASAAGLFANHGGTHTGYHLSQLGWLRQNLCPWDRSSCRIAAASGNVEVKQWLIDHRCRCEGELHPTAAPAAAQNACQV